MPLKDLAYKTKAVGSIAKLIIKMAVTRPSPDDADNVATRLSQTADAYPNSTAIIFDGRSITWRELDDEASRIAQALKEQGVEQGDSISFMFDSSIELVANLFGCLRAGAQVALLNTNLRGPQLRHCIGTTDSKKLLFGDEHTQAIAEVKGETELSEGADFLWTGSSAPPNWATNFTELADQAEPIRELPETKRSDCALYLFTSGTTGMPKAAIQTQHKLLSALDISPDIMLKLKHTDRLYLCLPLYHGTGLAIGLLPAIRAGATVVLRRKFSASAFLDEVREHGCNAFVYIGELCRYLMAQPEKSDDADNPLTKVVGNGLRPDIWMDFKKRFDIEEIFELYASSEGNAGFMNFFNQQETIGAAVIPPVLVEYDVNSDEVVRGEDGFCRRVGKGKPGLLLGAITEVMAFDGYTDAEATEKKILRDVFKAGDAYFNTGDLIREIDVGFTFGFKHFQFVDRVGDTFRWKGENCSTNEVGEIINAHPSVQICNVYGVQIPGTDGRAGMASIVLHEGQALDPLSLAELVNRDLAPYARPVFLRVLPELPLTGTFKMQKGDLREEAYHLDKVGDPLYVMKPGSREYEPLDSAFYEQIQSGQSGY